jgi:hypothetical protein
MRRIGILAVAVLAGLLAALPAAAAAPPVPPAPSEFVHRVDNPWFPLRPGTVYRYRGVKDGKPSRDLVVVTRKSKLIQGVRCTVVRDRLYLRGRLEERTQDWYAQDSAGNVWYFGEATAELKPDGSVRTTEGSWQSGVDGASGGIFMPAHPHPGQTGLQEFFKGHAEDHFRVLSLDAHVRTPAISSDAALLTREWTPLEPGVVDHKFYVRGIGTVLEQTIRGGDERNTLISVRHPRPLPGRQGGRGFQ